MNQLQITLDPHALQAIIASYFAQDVILVSIGIRSPWGWIDGWIDRWMD